MLSRITPENIYPWPISTKSSTQNEDVNRLLLKFNFSIPTWESILWIEFWFIGNSSYYIDTFDNKNSFYCSSVMLYSEWSEIWSDVLSSYTFPEWRNTIRKSVWWATNLRWATLTPEIINNSSFWICLRTHHNVLNDSTPNTLSMYWRYNIWAKTPSYIYTSAKVYTNITNYTAIVTTAIDLDGSNPWAFLQMF